MAAVKKKYAVAPMEQLAEHKNDSTDPRSVNSLKIRIHAL